MNKTLWLQAALVVSFAFNVATVIMYLRYQPPAHPRTPEEFISRVVRHMSDDDAQKLKASFAQFETELRQKHIASDQAMDGVRAALSAEPFQQDQLAAAMDKARQAHEDSEQIFQQAVLDAAPKLSHAGRIELIPPPHGPRDQPAPSAPRE